jgi:CubicO group peptidase (beta-lactamase class C family)
MATTRSAFDTSDGAKIPVGYAATGQKGLAYNTTWPAFDGAGALRSTLGDMQRYVTFAMDGTSSPELARLRPLLFDWHTFDNATTPGQTEQGLGWQRLPHPFGNDIDVVWKNGGVPSFASYVAFSERLGEGVVVLANRAPPCGAQLQRAAFCVFRAVGEAVGEKFSAGPNCQF